MGICKLMMQRCERRCIFAVDHLKIKIRQLAPYPRTGLLLLFLNGLANIWKEITAQKIIRRDVCFTNCVL